ncbi:hypothetical protein HKX48_001015 [Thoreauomyces humboldtii]|nr:hypothetical protein HKX48_001015 [Thoreauomyces humboldtii]
MAPPMSVQRLPAEILSRILTRVLYVEPQQLSKCLGVCKAFYVNSPIRFLRLLKSLALPVRTSSIWAPCQIDCWGEEHCIDPFETARYLHVPALPLIFLRDEFPLLLQTCPDRPALPVLPEKFYVEVAEDIHLAASLTANHAETRVEDPLNGNGWPTITGPLPARVGASDDRSDLSLLLERLAVHPELRPHYSLERRELDRDQDEIVEYIHLTLRSALQGYEDEESTRDEMRERARHERREARRIQRRGPSPPVPDFEAEHASFVNALIAARTATLLAQGDPQSIAQVNALPHIHDRLQPEVQPNGVWARRDGTVTDTDSDDSSNEEAAAFDARIEAARPPIPQTPTVIAPVNVIPVAEPELAEGYWTDGEETPDYRQERRVREAAVRIFDTIAGAAGATHVLFLALHTPNQVRCEPLCHYDGDVQGVWGNWIFVQRGSGQNLVGRMWLQDYNP